MGRDEVYRFGADPRLLQRHAHDALLTVHGRDRLVLAIHAGGGGQNSAVVRPIGFQSIQDQTGATLSGDEATPIAVEWAARRGLLAGRCVRGNGAHQTHGVQIGRGRLVDRGDYDDALGIPKGDFLERFSGPGIRWRRRPPPSGKAPARKAARRRRQRESYPG